VHAYAPPWLEHVHQIENYIKGSLRAHAKAFGHVHAPHAPACAQGKTSVTTHTTHHEIETHGGALPAGCVAVGRSFAASARAGCAQIGLRLRRAFALAVLLVFSSFVCAAGDTKAGRNVTATQHN
jgi:hypothetical protein